MGLFALFGGTGEFAEQMADTHRTLLGGGSGDGTVRILPMALADERIAEEDLALYERLGVRSEVVPVRAREDARLPSNADALRGASLIFVHGGYADWVAQTLQDTPVWRAVLRELHRGCSLAATSGGIMALGAVVPAFNEDFTEHEWQPGLALFPELVIGSHWDAERFAWMVKVYGTLPPDRTILAVDEATVAVGDGAKWMVAGSGAVRVIGGGRERACRAGEELTADLAVPRDA